ncbi:apolipoprotein B-100-like [Lampris incognitus]|uniref:apolipoprotein B-100-like n=1 Tax=Lampris incognitus TaxID=2546036 RepID=UPI0024B5DC09|nr:apolipoprotein B-100-like [Lampris incognitus]
MGGTKLCVLLLLSTYALAQQDVDGQSPTCFLARRFKNFKRFVYNYEAETLNGVNGAADLKNGPKVSCKVEIDVPQTCSFILRTSECSLMEAVDVSAEGAPVFGPAANAEAFKVAMAKNPLKFMVEGQTDVKLFPEEDEPVNILNVKRGIISALVVPAMEEERNREMATVHGVCTTDFTVNSREEIATDVTVSRDLSRCDRFSAKREHTSPLALISGMNYPLSKMISSTQTCNYKFDNQRKHMTGATCTEKHIFMPFSHQNEYGILTLVKQTLTLRDSSKINDRVFNHNENNLKFLHMEAFEDKAPIQTKDAAVAAMRELSTLSQASPGHQRASTFHRLVSELRGLKADILSSAALDMMDMSQALTWQALAQCGTPECSSAMLSVLRTFDKAAIEVDAAIYALGLLPNPSRLLVKDMLAMAQYKQSKPIMFALSNAMRKLYQAEGKVTPEMTAVSEFMASILGEDCAGEKERTFMTLRVIGNMGEVMEAADPTIKTTLLKCMRQPATTLSVQLAAIQAFRRMSVTDEVRSNLQRVSQYAKGAVQKRLAAYLILMRNPEASDFEMIKKMLKQEQNPQVKAFVTSHIHNIISSTDPETQRIGKKIVDALQNSDVDSHTDYTTMSRNYKLEMANEQMQAKIQGNTIFDSANQLPKEVLLETTLKAFGYNMDLWEVGIEGKGFEPTIESLFGKNGFFPDTVSKAMYWAGDKMPAKISEVLEKWASTLKSGGQKKQVPENLVREIVRNFNKLTADLQAQESTEAMAYLRIMGNELGYIKGSELKGIAQYAIMYAEVFLKTLPTEAMKKLISGTDNEIFGHYIFMDNKFTLSTASGLPLKFALSGTFAAGAKGGLRIAPNMQEVSFSPSVGTEFVTQMGVHIPEFVVSAVEMHTNIYHESSLNARITMDQGQVKLSIPAPQGSNQLFRISNRMLSVTTGQVTLIPHKDEGRTNNINCRPLFPGIKYCTTLRYSVAGANNAAPYFPLNGETKFSVDLQPTGEVSEFTATIAYKLLSEGKEGRHKTDSLKMILRAEGEEPTEATVTMKYNRNRNIFTTNVQIPDFDVETGIRVGLTDSSAKGKSITLEVTNKNIPQLSLIGRAKLQAMTDGMLQVQLVVPSLKTDAAITGTIRNTEGLTMEIKSDIKLLETSSIQAVIFKYGTDQAEVQLMSNMNSGMMRVLVPYTEAFNVWLKQLVDDVMDQQVVKTDMKLGHIFTKAVEASNIWMDKITADVPYVQTVRDSMKDLAMPSMPETLFMNLESTFRYRFNKDHITLTIPLPLGGKSSEELRIPSMLTTPHMSVPQVGLELAQREIQVPTFTIPTDYDLNLPLMGMVEASAKVNSNYYNWEGMVSAGNNTAESPNYLIKFKVMADSPIELLSFTSEGAAQISDTPEVILKVAIDGSMKHKLMDASFDVLETMALSDKMLSTGSYNIQASSPLGLRTSLDVTSQLSLGSDMLSGDGNVDGSMLVGSMSASTTYSHSFSIKPMMKEAKAESKLTMKSPILKVMNEIKGNYANEQLLIESNTEMNNEPVKHTTKFSIGYKDAQLTVQSNSETKVVNRVLRSQVDFAASRAKASIRVENQADDNENRAYTLLSGSMDPSGVEVNADASVNIFATRASHKATLSLNMNGLTTSCTTTAHSSIPLTFENAFHGGVDTTGATMSITTKGSMRENKAELNVEGKIGGSEAYLKSMFEGNLFNANTRNAVNLRVNRDSMTFSNNLVGSLNEIRTDSTHSMTLTLRSLMLQSKTDNFFDNKNSYKHDITIRMEPFTALVKSRNDLKIMDANFVNEAELRAQPFNLEMTGTMMGTFSEEQLKHTYEIKFVDMILSTKYDTNGKLLGSRMTHTTDMEISGLRMVFNNRANFNSPSLRFDSTVETIAAPFTLHIDAIFNSNGDIYLYGQQNGELYSKFLLKAEPLVFMHSFENRASSTHEMENGVSMKTNMNNKFNSLMTLQEQSVTLKMTSKLNDHALSEEMNIYNNAEKMGVELNGAVSTTLFNKAGESHDYTISGFVKYDKNSDSHFLQIPFIEYLPAVIDEMKTTIVKLMDNSIEMLRKIYTENEISSRIHLKVSELKEVIETFDFRLFGQDMKNFINSMEKYITSIMAKFNAEEVVNVLKSIRNTIVLWLKKLDIPTKINVIYNKIEVFLSHYEVENIIEKIMDEAVEIMKQYRVREKIQSAFATLRSIDIQPLLDEIMAPVKELVNELYAFDFKQMIGDMSDYFIKMVEKIKSFDYEAFTMELKDKVTEISKVPCFGKLHGEFKIISPDYRLKTTAELRNITTTLATPEFTMNFTSQATSTFDLLAYDLDANAHLAIPKMSRLSLTEKIMAVHTALSLDHQGAVNFYGLSAQGNAKTTVKATTEPYVAELVSDAFFALENGVSVKVDNAYKHEVNMPLLNIFSDASFNQKAVALLEAGTLRLTTSNDGKGKYAVQDYSDEATHKSDIEVVIDLHTAKVTSKGETQSGYLKMNQNVNAEICIFRHVIIDARAETVTPFMKNSVAELKVQAKVEDLKIDVTASHDAELVGQVEGKLSNSLLVLATPSQFVFDTKNKGNPKVTLPFKLSVKTDLQNDMAITLNSEVQQASWTGLARFNQYKFSHYLTMDNREREIQIFAKFDGEANLDKLKQPISIPEMTVPFFAIKTPKVESYSLWEDTGLNKLLTTTQQTFNMDAKLKYIKNPEMITFDIDMEPIIDFLNTNGRILHKNLLVGKDKAVVILTKSYGQAKAEYDKYSIEMPETVTIPAYKVPVLDIEVSSFTIPLPDFSFITMPALHIPSAISKLTLPKITLPKMQKSIMIPAMGDLTYEFSMKTAVITLKTDASILNQGDIIIKLDASSSSEFDVLTGKIEGTTTINRVNGMKMASVLSAKHMVVEGNHDSTININNGAVDASMTNSAKVILPVLIMEINQEMFGNPQEGLILSVSSPSAGLLGLQLQAKHPAQVKGRIFGRYPSEPTNEVDILALKMSVMNFEKLSLQTAWNMEVPYEMMLGIKERVPTVISPETIQDIVSDPISKAYSKITNFAGNLEGSFEQAKEQGKVMFKRAADNFEALNLSRMTTVVSDSTILILRKYQKNINIFLDAVIKFLGETKFQIPGFGEKMSGFEVYQSFSTFVADVSKEAIRRAPEYLETRFELILNYFRGLKFTLPGSRRVVSGREILHDVVAAVKKIQGQLIAIVKTLGDINLEDIIKGFSRVMNVVVERAEELLKSTGIPDVDMLSASVSAVYTDAINSQVLADITKNIAEVRRVVEECIDIVRAKFEYLFADMSIDQLQVDIQSFIDSMVERVNALYNNVIEYIKEMTKKFDPFVRMSDRQMDIDIPLPYIAKFN